MISSNDTQLVRADVATSTQDGLMAAFHAMQSGNFENTRAAIEKDTNIVNAAFADGSLLLHWASLRADGIRIVQLLVNLGADVNRSGGALGENPLMWAARNQFLAPTLRFLLENGSNINHRNIHGQDALSVACQSGQPAIAFILYVSTCNVRLTL